VTYSTPEYSGAALVSAGTSAVAGSGVGVRRAVLEFSQTAPGTVVDDKRMIHWDFMNLTGGAPDDTWTDTDYAGLETILQSWLTGIQAYITQEGTFTAIKWYREGTGVVPPNPAERVTPISHQGTGASLTMPPQTALSITLKTARRKQWGRTYLPGVTSVGLGGRGAVTTSVVDAIGAATNTMVLAAIAEDMHPGVLSKVAGSFFTLEQLQIDDVWDVIRSRRWKNTTHRYQAPT
jgi:hypothetical protein